MSVLEMPEEEVAVVFRGDFNVAGVHSQEGFWCAGKGMDEVVGTGLICCCS